MDASSEATFTIQQLLRTDPSKIPPLSLRRMELLISEQVKSATKQFRDLSLPPIVGYKDDGLPELTNVRGVCVYTTGKVMGNWATQYRWYVDRDSRWYRDQTESHVSAGLLFHRWSFDGVEEFLQTIVRMQRLDPENIPLKVLADVCNSLMKPLTSGAESAHQREVVLSTAAAAQQEVLDFIASVKR